MLHMWPPDLGISCKLKPRYIHWVDYQGMQHDTCCLHLMDYTSPLVCHYSVQKKGN